jgi:hypothetical protein
MKADEAAELIDSEKQQNTFKQRAAIVIAFFAMLLAVTGLGGQNATKEALNSNILAANDFAFYQAKNIRQNSMMLAADQIELAWAASAVSDDAKAALRTKLEDYRATIERYESDPTGGEGKKELLARAHAHEVNRDRALKQDPYFDYSEALLQIAIVLISVSIVAEVVWLAWFGGALGLIGGLLMVNGYLLLIEVPGLA